MDPKLKRNIAVVGHAHCGKTSLCESILFVSGATSRKGDVMKGSTVSDFNDDEIERQISINASFLRTVCNGHQIQIIDTPGYMDFIGETVGALRAVDAAVVVVDAVNGVEVGTEETWQKLDAIQMPRIIFINKIEKEDAHVEETIASIQEELSRSAQIIDFESSSLVEAVAETDDDLLEKYLENGSLPADDIKSALRKAVIEGKIFPIITGSAVTDAGIKDLLEAIIADLPSPITLAPVQANVAGSEETQDIALGNDGPLVGFVFKSLFHPHLGHIALMRIFSGNLTGGSSIYNVNKGSNENISTLTLLQGKDQSSTQQAECGDIIALTKLKHTTVSDTLSVSKSKIKLNSIQFPEPCISSSIKPKSRADEEKISTSLHKMCDEDHTLTVGRDTETNEMIISGMGDLHIKVIVDRMKRRYNLEVDLGTPKVAYRETITRPSRARHKYKKQSGGRGQYGDVELEIAPIHEEGKEYEFVNKIFGGAIPKNYIPSVEKGVIQAINDGPLAGSKIINIQVAVVDGSYHDVDSSDMAFQIAGAKALKEAVKLASPVLLEPIMDVSVVVPSDFIGQISGDVSSRRGHIMGTGSKGRKEVVKANVPLSEMFAHASDLRSMTGGRGSYSMKFAHYETAPSKVTQQVIAQKQADAEA